MKDNRIKWIDEVRGLVIILVILGHVIGGLSADIGGGDDNALRQLVYSFHMPLMFVVSGLVASDNNYDGINKFLQRIIRLVVALYMPYLLWGYLFWGTKYFIYAGNVSVSLKQGMELFWNYSAWVPGWYLLTLLFIKIMDLIIDSFLDEPKIKLMLWIGLFILGGWLQDTYLIANILKFGIYFQIGKNLKSMAVKENHIINSKNCFMILCVASIFRFAGDLNYIMDFGIAVSISFMIILLFSKAEYHSMIMETMGRLSMVPYVLHAYMTIPIRIILQKLGCQNFAVFVIAETGAAILFSLIVIKCIDHFKWMKVLFYPAAVLSK